MPALGELFIYLIYVFLVLGAVGFIYLTFYLKKSRKPWTILGCILCCFLFFNYRSCLKDAYKRSQLTQVGIYYLTEYPNCDNCKLELKEDMTYEVRSNGKVIEKSNWHYEVGGDYWITYLNNDNHHLGSGNYAYKEYDLKYDPRRN